MKIIEYHSCRVSHILCEDIIRANNENEVIHKLVSFNPDLAFRNSRYYDAFLCPFRSSYFFVLRYSSREYQAANVGYKIYDATLTDFHIESIQPAWETFADSSVKNFPTKTQWVKDLELETSGWVDIPVVAGKELLGLWALDRNASQKPDTSELGMLQRIASVAALKIKEIRHNRIKVLTDKIFHESETAKYGDRILEYCVKDICKALNAKFAAYFAFTPIHGKLIKLVEVYNRGNSFELVEGPADKEYSIGQCLTGKAWQNPNRQYLPDLSEAMDREPYLIDENSRKLHSRLAKHPIVCVIYKKIDMPGATHGLIRAMNRADNQDLTFTSEHKAILNRIAYPLANTLGISDASVRLSSVWGAFSKTVTELRNEGLNYSSIANAARNMSFPTTLVTVWRQDGILNDVWANDTKLKEILHSKIGVLKCPELIQRTNSSIEKIQQLPKPFRTLLEAFDYRLIYVVPVLTRPTTRSTGEFTVTLFPLQIAAPKAATDFLIESFWEQHSDMLTALDILGRLAGTARELARNRSLLYCAEEAIGTIGHEMTTPTASLHSLSQELSFQERRVINSLPETVSVSSYVTVVGPDGTIHTQKLNSRDEVIAWLNATDKKLAEHASILGRVVTDALRWARLGGESVEMHLKKVDLYHILLQCIDQLKDQIRKKQPLQVNFKKSVHKIQPIVLDPFLIYVLFINLLDNAIKYSHRRGKGYDFIINISIEQQANIVDINITNWGLGIDESDYENIFSSFYRSAVRDRLHTVRGVGLGLATCNKIIALHKGSIKVRSVSTLKDPDRIKAKEGYLTTFTVRLPTNLKPGRIDIDTTTLNQRGIRN